MDRAGTIWVSRRHSTLRAVPISESSIWRVSRRTASTSINPTGAPSIPWRTSCRIGPGRTVSGQVTPVHVYTSGDEAELFLNGKSLGRKKKAQFEYRLRWDDVVYEPGELHVVAYKNGKQWATDSVKTAGTASKLLLAPDRPTIATDGKDLSFVTLTVADTDGQMVPRSMNPIHFEISGPGEIVATDNGDPTDMTAFPSKDRKAFNGLALVIVRAKPGQHGQILVTAKSEGLTGATANVIAKSSTSKLR